MKWKNVLVIGLFLIGMANISYAETAGVGISKLNDKPAGQTRESAMFKALAHTMNLNGSARTQDVTPNSGSETASVILPGVRNVSVGTVTNAATDFIVLPALSTVPVGHTINVASNAGGAYEIRTPASSSEQINNVISDGAQEYLAVDEEVHVFVKISDTDGWHAHDLLAAGGIGGATTPD